MSNKKEREIVVNDFKSGISIEEIAKNTKCEKEVIEQVIRSEFKGKK